ncbi:hypothetical protein [Falsiroseomonas oryziterrae]|uniref:hypothetical protein n=1 Tax=Falsiroseomonas oryziterrae TaxID=2911368 RepID=UPI001F17D3ED|nr:hypothetical protein [Roseomonas sp. NPKOSM-4]
MADTGASPLSIAITPMHRGAEGIWESGGRSGAAFFLVEIVQGDGSDAEVVLECKDERSAALAARVVAATAAALGLASEQDGDIPAYDDETAAILSQHETPEIAMPAGAWGDAEEEDEEEGEEPGGPDDGTERR